MMKSSLALLLLTFSMVGTVTAQAADIQCREYFSREATEFNLVLDRDARTIGLPDPQERGSLIKLPILNETEDEIMAAGYVGGLISLVLNRRDGGLWVSYFTDIEIFGEGPRGFRNRIFRCRWDLPN